MRWYRKLYLGEQAAEAKYKMFGKIRRGRFQMDTYLITVARGPDNLLEIYSANMLKQPYFKKKSVQDQIYVVGLAKGYDEALEVVRRIIDDVYRKTGAFDVCGCLKFGQSLRSKGNA